MNNTPLRGINGMTASQAKKDPYSVKRNLMEIYGERPIYNSIETQEKLKKDFIKKNRLYAPGSYVFYTVVCYLYVA